MTRVPFDPRRDVDEPGASSVVDADDPRLVDALHRVRSAIFKYPMAIQAAFSALVAEGRAYAATEEGAKLCEQLSVARRMGRARLLWDVLSLSAFTEHHDGPLPSVFADMLVRAIRSEHLEPLLSKVLDKRS